jgi:hypothetical protein
MRLINGKRVFLTTWLGLLVIFLAIFALITPHGFIDRAIEKARRRSAGYNFSMISYAYVFGYLPSGNESRKLPGNLNESAHAAAYIFARENQLNDASVYFVSGDPLAPKNLPKTVLLGDLNNPASKPNPEFANAILGVVIAANLAFDSPVTSTPIVWTRGLQPDGTWSPNSPFGVEGGYIAYLDGHYEWADKFSFVKYGTNIPTTNIREALPPGAVILSAEPAKAGH